MADKKVTELTAITNLSGDDLLLVVNDPLGTPDSRKVTLTNFFANVAVSTVHTATSTFRANTTFSGTKVTVSSNLMLGSTNALDAINDRYQVANVNSLFVDSTLTGNTGVTRLVASNVYALQVPVAAAAPGTTNASSVSTGFSGGGIPAGCIWVSNNNLYVATDANNIKRTRLSHYPSSVVFDMNAGVGNTTYVTSGGGTLGTGNETLYLYKGFTYQFRHPAAHPIEIRNSSGGSAYSNGVNIVSGTVQYFTVPQNQVSNLVYQCTTHASMVGTLVIV